MGSTQHGWNPFLGAPAVCSGGSCWLLSAILLLHSENPLLGPRSCEFFLTVKQTTWKNTIGRLLLIHEPISRIQGSEPDSEKLLPVCSEWKEYPLLKILLWGMASHAYRAWAQNKSWTIFGQGCCPVPSPALAIWESVTLDFYTSVFRVWHTYRQQHENPISWGAPRAWHVIPMLTRWPRFEPPSDSDMRQHDMP